MYNIEELALMSGFGTRSLRNYIKSGILRGSKAEGRWQFTEEEVSEFFNHPSVRPGIESKQNSAVYDFLAERGMSDSEACVLLNLKRDGTEAGKISEFFCTAAGRSEHIRFAFSFKEGKVKLILKGTESEVRDIMRAWYAL